MPAPAQGHSVLRCLRRGDGFSKLKGHGIPVKVQRLSGRHLAGSRVPWLHYHPVARFDAQRVTGLQEMVTGLAGQSYPGRALADMQQGGGMGL
jgi:hypothetical protein